MYSLNDIAPTSLVALLENIEFQVELLFWLTFALAVGLFIASIRFAAQARIWRRAAGITLLFAFFGDGLVYRHHMPEVCSFAGFYENDVHRPDVHIAPAEKITRERFSRIRTGPHGAFELTRSVLVNQPLEELVVLYEGPRWHWYLFEIPLRGIGGRDVFTNCNKNS
jgi:hypothetical protein